MITAQQILQSPDPAFLKLMHAHGDQVIIDQFRREYKRAILKMLINPIAVTHTMMYDAGNSGGYLFDYRQISPKHSKYYDDNRRYTANNSVTISHIGYDIGYTSSIFGGSTLLLFTRHRVLHSDYTVTNIGYKSSYYELVNVVFTSPILPHGSCNSSAESYRLRRHLLYSFFPDMLKMIIKTYCPTEQP